MSRHFDRFVKAERSRICRWLGALSSVYAACWPMPAKTNVWGLRLMTKSKFQCVCFHIVALHLKFFYTVACACEGSRAWVRRWFCSQRVASSHFKGSLALTRDGTHALGSLQWKGIATTTGKESRQEGSEGKTQAGKGRKETRRE